MYELLYKDSGKSLFMFVTNTFSILFFLVLTLIILYILMNLFITEIYSTHELFFLERVKGLDTGYCTLKKYLPKDIKIAKI